MTASARADLLELGRRGRSQELAEAVQAARRDGGWTALAALELATAWLLAGELRLADLALLEADQLDPGLGLVPDVWGLWPTSPVASAADAEQVRALALAERFRAWRHADAQALWQELLPQLRRDWRLALEPAVGDPLRILARLSGRPGAATLDPPLEPELAQLVSDAEIVAEPAASNRYWQLLAGLRPDWGLARLRAADLALARGELEASGRWLADPPDELRANPWFHDVVARQAVAQGEVGAALDAWAEAIMAARTDAATASLVELFEQRRREARRGPGVLQVRSLANRGAQPEALALLERLLADDPQWQPLRSLREQLQASAAAAPTPDTSSLRPPGASTPPESPGAADTRSATTSSATGFDGLLDRATARLQSLGHSLPPAAEAPSASDATATDLAGLAEALEALERRLSTYEARFALA